VRGVVAAGWVATLLVVAVGLPGCVSSGSGPDPAQVLRTRLAALMSARSLGLDGTVTMQDTSYVVSLNENDQADATGGITVGQTAVTFTWRGSRLFLRGRKYFEAKKVHAGDRWVLDQDAALGALLRALTNRAGLIAAIGALAGPRVSQHAGPQINGMPTIQLISDRVTVTVPARGGAPWRLATAPDQQLSDGLQDLKLNVAASNAPAAAVSEPELFIDLADKNSLPAGFDQVTAPADTFRFDGCDGGGCTLSAEFENSGGRQGTAHATFEVDKGGAQLSFCTVVIPATDYGGTVRAGCRVNWDTTAAGTDATVSVANPD
jgi:hypothetical protein